MGDRRSNMNPPGGFLHGDARMKDHEKKERQIAMCFAALPGLERKSREHQNEQGSQNLRPQHVGGISRNVPQIKKRLRCLKGPWDERGEQTK